MTKKLFVFSRLLLKKVTLMHRTIWDCVIKMVLELRKITKMLFVFSLLLLNKVTLMHSTIWDCVIKMVLEL